MEKTLCLASLGVAVLIGLVFALDLAVALPFGRVSLVQDVMFIVAAGLILWQGYEIYRQVS